MANIGLIDVDSHNYPNLCQMKLSAFHKQCGDTVERYNSEHHYDKVYISRVFDDIYTKDWTETTVVNADNVIRGGTGYNLTNELPKEIEHIMPDYSLYGIEDKAFGFLTRGCPRHCGFCIVGDKEGLASHKVADVTEFWNGQKYIDILDPNLLACKNRIELLEQLIDTKAKVNINQGLDIRFTTEDVALLLKKLKPEKIHFAWDNPKQNLLPMFERYAAIKGCKPTSHGGNGTVYVLTNFDSSIDEDLYRIYHLRDLGFKPFVMIFDKPHAPIEIRKLARWCNNNFVFYKTPRFEDYDYL